MWHYIREDAVKRVALLELRRMVHFLADDEEHFFELLTQKTNVDIVKEQKQLESALQKVIARSEEVGDCMKGSTRIMYSAR